MANKLTDSEIADLEVKSILNGTKPPPFIIVYNGAKSDINTSRHYIYVPETKKIHDEPNTNSKIIINTIH